MKRILLIDDSEVARLIMKKCLADAAQFDILEADGGRKALDLLSVEDVDLIFLDVTMPEMSGIDVARHLSPELRSLVVVMTGDRQNATASSFQELGITDVLYKPPGRACIADILKQKGIL